MENKAKISEAFKKEGQFSYEVLLTVPGRFLLAQNIQNEWAEARGIDPKQINNAWEDNITLLQAEALGVLEFAKDCAKRVEYKPNEEETLSGEEDEPQAEYKVEQKGQTINVGSSHKGRSFIAKALEEGADLGTVIDFGKSFKDDSKPSGNEKQ